MSYIDQPRATLLYSLIGFRREVPKNLPSALQSFVAANLNKRKTTPKASKKKRGRR